MGKALAVDGCTLIIQGGTGPTPSITNQPSTKVLADGKGVFFKEIKVSLSGVTAGTITNSDGQGEGTITGTGTKITDANGDPAVLEGDVSANITVNGTMTTQSGPQKASGVVTVKVSKAGQTVVVAL